MRQVTFTKQVLLFLDNLTDVLHDKKYFGSLEFAQNYVNNLYELIHNTLPHKQHKATPKKFLKYGNYYTKLKINKRTTWIVFFNKNKNRQVFSKIYNQQLYLHLYNH